MEIANEVILKKKIEIKCFERWRQMTYEVSEKLPMQYCATQ